MHTRMFIHSADAKRASVATAARYESAACDERNFSSSEERALAPLALAPQRSASSDAFAGIAEKVNFVLTPLIPL